MEELTYDSVKRVLELLKPHSRDSWRCSPEVKEKLEKLDPNTVIKVYRTSSFRLADDYPSYYIEDIVIWKR